MLDIDAIFGPSPVQEAARAAPQSLPTPADNAAMAEVLALVDQARAVRPFDFLDDLARLARGYHQRGEHDMLQDAVTTARRVLNNLRTTQAPA